MQRSGEQKTRAQNSRPWVGRYEVQTFDCARIACALRSDANLAPVRGNIRGFSGVTPSAVARSPGLYLACISHLISLRVARVPSHESRITNHSWLWGGLGVALGWPWGGLGVALRWLCTPK